MPNFGRSSRSKLETCDERLQRVLNRAIKSFDFTMVWGHRGEEDQNRMYEGKPKRSKLRWPDSKHNEKPSKAVDVAPWVNGQIPWNRAEYFYILVGVIMAAAQKECVAIRYGCDWDGDGNLVKYDDDETLNDIGHFEILGS